MDSDEVEDVGIIVDGLLDSNIIDTAEELLKKAGTMPDNGIALDSWTTTSEVMAVDSTVMALLVKNTGGGGVVRVLGKPAKYTKSDGLPGVVLLVLKPGEKFLLLGSLSIRYIRRRVSQ
ncbi:hypothetical protein N7489_011708 [Penicillium chrysogenum]|uniref:uncharacterized protein n=1 Tax=Penicillium chrysogenum TaxID=5076 RepID=UPI0024DF2ED0|nr:uncharacterized protein N7489_011708 [Penicillium chrysogenum]KAJ5231000.1 hypothetical protein N7489_011708 [Penicillium chrysogenum]